MSKERSECHNAPVTINSQDKGWRGITNWYICSKCKEECDLKVEKDDKDKT